MQKIAWEADHEESAKASSQIYSAKFVNPKKELIIAGGADRNVTKIFSTDTGKAVAEFGEMPKPCLVTDTSGEGNMCLIGCADGSIIVRNL